MPGGAPISRKSLKLSLGNIDIGGMLMLAEFMAAIVVILAPVLPDAMLPIFFTLLGDNILGG